MVLFLGQLLIPNTHGIFTTVYLVLGCFYLSQHRQYLFAVGRGVMTEAGERRQAGNTRIYGGHESRNVTNTDHFGTDSPEEAVGKNRVERK